MTELNKIEQCARLIQNAKNVLVLTGAGMSTESGIPDFRSINGLYAGKFKGLSPEIILSTDFFKEHPELFWEFISIHMNYSGAKPNIGHYILAKWQQYKDVTILTQNIEQLHQLSGSLQVIELHGNIKTATCLNVDCGEKYTLEDVLSKVNGYICKCGSPIKPDVVLYGDYVDNMSSAYSMIKNADLLIVLGTSLTVYPVAEIPELFDRHMNHMIIVNRALTRYNNTHNCIEIHGSIGKVLQAIDSLAFRI